MLVDISKGPRLGVVTGVESDIATIGLYNLTNDPQMIWNGDILPGPKVGSYVTIFQYDVKIIASVFSEKVSDQQNSINNKEFDNRYNPNSINRVIQLKTKGVILDGKFSVTSKYVPMVGNEVHATTQQELDLIYGVTSSDEKSSLEIGESLLEGLPVKIDVNRIFASHIGIFGNTGSGKSNTLHYLYLKLLEKYSVLKKSRVILIDFNGEYTANNSFNVEDGSKNTVQINSYHDSGDKVEVSSNFFFDSTTLIKLFSARSGVQAPFLVKTIEIFNETEECLRILRDTSDDEKIGSEEFKKIESFISGSTRYVLQSGVNKLDLVSEWFSSVRKYLPFEAGQFNFENLKFTVDYGDKKYTYQLEYLIDTSNSNFWEYTGFNKLSQKLAIKYLETPEPLERFFMIAEFQKSYQRYFKSGNLEFLNPLFLRMESTTRDLSKSIKIVDSIDESNGLCIVSLKNANLEMKRLIPMLLSRMYYQMQKDRCSSHDSSTHLIIDEAHNILSSADSGSGDALQDYRLYVFEEIIKEGRKFGFFLTLASQRPFDISATIISQLHNNFIHRLVNDKDLQAIQNSVPTMDRGAFAKIPSLGKGEVLIAGSGIPVPVFVKIPHSEIRPESDDLCLVQVEEGGSYIWSLKNEGETFDFDFD